MKTKLVAIVAGVAFIGGVLITSAFSPIQEVFQPGIADHQRFETTIEKMQDIIDYMEKTPHDFGSHKEEAVKDTKQAIVSLKLVEAYHPLVDSKN
ncbi:MAG TPA: hypothetical protein VK783_11145 [Bacteroidia bacterium]|jgi:hypothetical protein|nr:hypothetical protein [Bacteroidia bacterium]